jgi:hypothetical protein
MALNNNNNNKYNTYSSIQVGKVNKNIPGRGLPPKISWNNTQELVGCGRKVWKFLVPPRPLKYWFSIRVSSISSFSMEILVFDVLFDHFEFRDRYGDVGHHLLVQDAPIFI